MLAPRGAVFVLLHLALQPWLGAGAQAHPQGKWARAGARAAGPGSPAVAVPRSAWASEGTRSARVALPLAPGGLAWRLSVLRPQSKLL